MKLLIPLCLSLMAGVAFSQEEIVGTPEENARALQTAITRPGHRVELPPGKIITNSFGVAALGGIGMGTTDIVGHGRNTMLELAPGQSEHGVLSLNNQGDWHDACMRNVAFYGNGNGKPILDISGYSLAFRDVFIRSNASTTQRPAVGLRVFNGQHFVLDNVQAEYCTTGIHLDAVSDVVMNGCNVEFCDVGLLLTPSIKAHTNITINQLYCESTGTGIRSEGVSFALIGGVYLSNRTNRRAVELINCQNCFIDQSRGSGKVYLDESSNGNMVIVEGSDQALVEDHGQANTIRTVAAPAVVTEPDAFIHREVVADSALRNWDRVIEMAEDDNIEFVFTYKTTKFAQIIAQFYDQLNREMFDQDLQQWVKLGEAGRSTMILPWQTGQVCQQALRVKAQGKSRKVQVRFLFRDAAGSVITLYSIKRGNE